MQVVGSVLRDVMRICRQGYQPDRWLCIAHVHVTDVLAARMEGSVQISRRRNTGGSAVCNIKP